MVLWWSQERGNSKEPSPSQDPTIRLNLGSYGGLGGGAVSHERGTLVKALLSCADLVAVASSGRSLSLSLALPDAIYMIMTMFMFFFLFDNLNLYGNYGKYLLWTWLQLHVSSVPVWQFDDPTLSYLVSGLQFRGSDFGIRDSSFASRFSGFWLRVPGSEILLIQRGEAC